jgi:Ca-activated chloride channel family protein
VVKGTHLASLALCILMSAIPAGSSDEEIPRRLILIVDASASMESTLGDGSHRFGAVRTALQTLWACLDSEAENLSTEVWAFGATADLTDESACADTRRLEHPDALDSVDPRGASPLAHALETVAEASGPFTDHDLVVLITDGLDSCGGDPMAAAGAFETESGDRRLQILGVSSPLDATATYLGMGVTRRPTSTAELIRDLLWMTEEFAGLKTAPRPVRLRLEPPTPGTAVFTGGQLIEPMPVSLAPDASDILPAEAVPGTYTITITHDDGSTTMLLRARHRREGPLEVAMPTGDPPTLDAEAVQADGVHPARLRVAWTDAGDEPLAVRVHRPRTPGGSWLFTAPVRGPSGELGLPSPDRFGPHTVHLVALREDHDLVLASTEVQVPGRSVDLEAPETYEPGFPIEVSWSWTGHPDDVLTVVPSDSEDEHVGPLLPAGASPPADLAPPEGGCPLEVRYLSAETRRILARAAVEPTIRRAGLLVPSTADAGATVAVHWWGPNAREDILTLARPETSPAQYQSWRDATEASPVTLTTPAEGGDYEIRYVAGGTEILAALPLVVIEPQIGLETPAQAAVGTRIPVAWTGPPGGDRVVAIAPAGSPPSRMFDFVSTSAGSPVTLAAPFDPGDWVVRYLETDPLRVMVENPIRIVP